MPGLLGFIFGMTLFLMFALLGAAIGQIQVFLIWLILVLFASSGMLNPSIQPLCGVSSFDARSVPQWTILCGQRLFKVRFS